MARSRSGKAQRGQSVLEYAILIVCVIAVIAAIQLYFKRAIQGRWKESSDQIGSQFTTHEAYSIQTGQQSARQEETGTVTEIERGSWTSSTVEGTTPISLSGIGATGIRADRPQEYLGAELNVTDFVSPSSKGGGADLGTHGVFDSGRISNTKLFEDD